MPERMKKILIAEDSRDIGDILKAELGVKGYTVFTCKDAETVMNVISREHPDLIILDILMRDRKGVRICRKIKDERDIKNIPVILLANDREEVRDAIGTDCGAVECITKPYVGSEIGKIIEKHLAPEASWTTKITIEEAIRQKKREKKPYLLCRFELHPDAALIFEQKYGEIRYSEMLDKVAHLIEELAVKHDKGMVLEQEEEEKFNLLIEEEKEKAAALLEKIKSEVDTALRGFYSRDDLQQGFVIRRDILTGREQKIPLLSISASASTS